MRSQSPMLTTSDTAPIVQKLVLVGDAPKTNASDEAAPRDDGDKVRVLLNGIGADSMRGAF